MLSFAGNAINFSFAIAPWRPVTDEARGLQLTVSVEVENAWGTNTFSEIHRAILMPNAQGIFNLDASLQLDAHLAYYVPAPQQRTITECPQQSRRYRLGYTLTDVNGIVDATAYTATLVAVKGGFAETYLPGNAALADTNMLLTTSIIRSGNPLYPRPFNKLPYTPHELRYAYFLARTTVTPDPEDRPAIDMVCADPDDNVTYTFAAQTYDQYKVYCIPLTLPVVALTVPPALVAFTLRMQGIDCENLQFEVDERPLYDARTLIYRDSAGGLGTLTLRGQIEWQQEYNRVTSSQIAWPDRFEQAMLRRTTIQQRASTTEKAKGYTGFLKRGQLETLLELFATDELYEHIEGWGLMPATLNSAKSRLYSNRDGEYALEIEWERAVQNMYNSPFAYPISSCPALITFLAMQANRNTLEFLWSIPQPYYLIEVEVDNGEDVETFTFSGNTGRVQQPFTNPAIGGTPEDITIKARVICNPYSSPVSVGPWTTITLEVAGNLPPVAVPDTVTINAGFNTPVELSVNVMENDYDPDGDSIECVVLTEAATAQGGELSLTATGEATYLPPSETFTGNDTIEYTIREIATPTLTASAILTIQVVGSTVGPTVNIYLRILTIDVVTFTNSTIHRVSGKRFVYFYSDPAGNTPLDLTGMGISFTVTETVRVVLYKESEEPNIDEVDTVTTYNAVGIRQLLRDGILSDTRFADGETTRVTTYTHVITPSPSFVILP